jgi:uncharacterized membrane protein YcaP (DUF421 family)
MDHAELLNTLFGEGPELDPLQMTMRAVAVFALALAMIRISGRRSFGQHRPFDACTTVLLGAVLSRAVVGASPFWATMCAGLAIVLMHRAIAMASIRWRGFERLVNGQERELVRDGRIDEEAMRKALLTRHDLEEAVRHETSDEHRSIRRAVLERDGAVTIVAAKKGEDGVAARSETGYDA